MDFLPCRLFGACLYFTLRVSLLWQQDEQGIAILCSDFGLQYNAGTFTMPAFIPIVGVGKRGAY